MTDELGGLLLELADLVSKPRAYAPVLAAAGVQLDRALGTLLFRVGRAEPVSVSDLAKLVNLDHSTVSRQLTKLQDLGLVSRRPAESDGRVWRTELTPEGRSVLKAFEDARQEMQARVLAEWEPAQVEQFTLLLGQFVRSVREAIEASQAEERTQQRRARQVARTHD